MTQIILNAVFAGMILLLAAETPFFIFLFWLWRYGKKQFALEKEYERRYKELQNWIRTFPVNTHNFLFLKWLFYKVSRMKYAKKEDISVLSAELFLGEKWRDEALKESRRSENKIVFEFADHTEELTLR